MKNMDTEYMGNEYDSKRSDDNKTLASLTHILGLFTWVIGPIIVYIMSDDEFVKQNAANAFSWQLFMSIYLSASVFLLFFFIGAFFLLFIPLLNVILPIIASVKALDGDAWEYPGTVDIIQGTERQSSKTATSQREKHNSSSKNHDTSQRETGGIDLDGTTEEELFEKYLDGKISEEEYRRKLEDIRNSDRVKNLEYN